MEVGATLEPADRVAWRAWLAEHHATARDVWLLLDDRPQVPRIGYLDAVEEAICFGWIDSIQKRHTEHERAQRFSPRRRGSGWTELNKERARRLVRLGLMTDAGRATLPDLGAVPAVPDEVVAALRAEPGAWERWTSFPELYRRVRAGYVEEVRRDPVEFERRLRSLVARTAKGTMFGNWNDGGRLG
jgi:uncharacterized protein YdeI (YjbR/CyaY-like superfamily)